MEEALRAKLLANPAIAAMAKKIVWGARPDASLLPSITLQQVGAGRNYTHGGADDLTDPLIQFDYWATSQFEAWTLERLVTSEMETPGTIGGVSFPAAFLESQQDFDPEDIDGGGTVYRRIADWRVYSQPAD
jgi:hypothetical protein